MAIEIEFTGSDFVLTKSDVSDECWERLKELGGPGQQDSNVAAFRRDFGVWGDPETCRDYLRAYGAWDDSELADHDSNLNRLVWLTGCDIAENGEAYFSAY